MGTFTWTCAKTWNFSQLSRTIIRYSINVVRCVVKKGPLSITPFLCAQYMYAYTCICTRVWVYICTRVGAICLFVLSNPSTTCVFITGPFPTPACVCSGGWIVGFFPPCPFLVLVDGEGGYVLTGVEIGVSSCIFLYYCGCYAGSRINFPNTFRMLNSWIWFQETHISRFCIVPNPSNLVGKDFQSRRNTPELEHLIEKRFRSLFSKKKPLKSDSWIETHKLSVWKVSHRAKISQRDYLD